jgi:hypothetical protein
MKTLGLCALGLSLVLAETACSSSDSSSSNTNAPAPTVVETLSGTVPAPVAGGPQQSSFVSFNSSGAGTGSVTLTSAIETLSNGSLSLNVVVGLQLGVPSGGGCTLAAGSTPLLTQASPSPISAPFVAGGNCILVTSGDQSAQAGPVSYTVVVVHF